MGDNFDLKKFLTENKLTQTNQINEQDEEWSITPSYDWYPQKSIKKKKSYILIEPGRIPLPIYVTNIDEDEVEYETDWQEGNEDYWESEFIGTEMEGLVYDPHTDWFDLDKVLYVKNVGDEVKIYLSKHEELNEQDEDDFNVTPNEEEWNKFEIGDIITVDWTNEMSHDFAKRFQNKPFKILEDSGENYYKVVPADKETKELWNKEMYWDFHYVKKNNVKPYYGELSEQDEDDFNVTPDESHWNELEVGDEVLVDWNMVNDFDIGNDMTWFNSMKNKPFKIIDKMKDLFYGNICGIAPVDEKDKDKWTWEIGGIWWVVEKALKPYQGSVNEQDDDEWSVTPDEKEWNKPGIGDTVLVDWDKEAMLYGLPKFKQFNGVPFEIVDERTYRNPTSFLENSWRILPINEEDKVKWIKLFIHSLVILEGWWINKNKVKPYTGPINEDEDDNDDFNVTPNEKEWNQPDIGSIVKVDFEAETDEHEEVHQFIGVPFEIVGENVKYDSWWVEPYRAKDKAKWKEVKMKWGEDNTYYWTDEKWMAFKRNVKPYEGSINEDTDDNDDFNVTPDERHWNVPEVGDIVTVDFKEETNRDDLSDVWQFTGIPFEIVSEEKEWWVEPYRAEDKIKWKETYEIYLKRNNFKPGKFWTDQGWSANKENVKQYIGPINEENNDDFTVDASDEWNVPGVGDIVTVDWNEETSLKPLYKFNNVPFKIVNNSNQLLLSSYYHDWIVEPYRAEDKAKWERVLLRMRPGSGIKTWNVSKENVKPYTGPINEEDTDDDFNVTASDEWNEPGIGDLVIVDFGKEGARKILHQFNNIPFKIVGEEEVDDGSAWWVEPARAEDKQKWKKVKARHNKNGSLWYWTSEGWCCFKSNVKPYTGSLNEDEDNNDDFNVVASDEWNKLGLDDIVLVDFIGRENIGIEALYQFNNVPFKIVDVNSDGWWVEPVKAEDKQKWKEVKMKYNNHSMLWYWTHQGWNTNKENVEPYEG